MKNYTPYHVHTQLSLLDSCTEYQEYIDRAKELGMKAFAFSEHGNIYEYYHKKLAIEEAGMKYIHAVEAYVTEEIDGVRDNYHVWLGAKNYDGFLELNELVSHSFNRKDVKIVDDDERYYYNPRMTFDDIFNTSDNIIITTACIGGVLGKGNEDIKSKFIKFLTENKHRCFLEIQHHNVPIQIEYNKYMWDLSKQTGIPLIAGTDTHALNETHIKGRSILQKSKNIKFDDEDGWDLTFKSYDELIETYMIQKSLPMGVVLEAIDNTNVMANMVEPFELSTENKYPHIYEDPVGTFKQKINQAYKKNKYVRQRYSKDKLKKVLSDELAIYTKTGSIDFMLLQTYLREWEEKNGIESGYGRGSVSGSMIAYLLGITQMDSMKFGLNFFRFMNPDRVSLADIDTDYGEADRAKVKLFLLRDHLDLPHIQCSEIITFNTIALKGAIRDVCRGLYADDEEINYLELADRISKSVDTDEEAMRRDYPEIFEYVDILNGTVVSVGSHPSGVLVTDIDLSKQIGLCSLATSKYPVSMLNMKELDALNLVKLDVLGLDNLGAINEACKLLGIERLTPDNVDLEDEAVWKSIRDDTTLIFQWESDSAQAYLKKFMSDETVEIAKKVNPNFSYIKWFSFGNGLIRPGCASFRDDVAAGDVLTTGFPELDDFLSITFGRITMQEDIMQFLVKFCGYSGAESDTVRRGIAKKKGTEAFIDEIHDRFISYSHDTYGQPVEKLEEIFPPIKQGILDATRYAFSWNHSDAYSCTGYICGYLRFYHPVEFLTASLNAFDDKEDKTIAITAYAKRRGIPILPIKFRHALSGYSCDSKAGVIYKGMKSIKYMNAQVADELYSLRNNKYDSFIDLLVDISALSIDSRQLDILIKLNFFEEFGDINNLLEQVELFNTYYGRKQLKIASLDEKVFEIAAKYAKIKTEKTLKDFDSVALLKEIVTSIETEPATVNEQIQYQSELLGYIDIVLPDVDPDLYYLVSIDGKYSPFYKLYNLKTGETMVIKCKKSVAKKNPVNPGQMLIVLETERSNKWGKDAVGDWYKKDEEETLLAKYEVVA